VITRFTLILLFVLPGAGAFCQNASTIFLTYSRSKPEPVFNRPVDGGPGYKSVASNTFGLRYLAKSSKIITLETGVDYSQFRYKLSYVDNPYIKIADITESVSVISVPVYAHLTFLKYLFVNGGLLLDAEIDRKPTEIDKQTGIGLGFGVGLKYNYKAFNIFINPFMERHGLIGLSDEQGTRQSIMNPGGRIGIGVSF
jgi:hypothetical protein